MSFITDPGRNPKMQDHMNPYAERALGQLKDTRQQKANIEQGGFLDNVLQGIGQLGDEASLPDILRLIAQGQQKGLSPENAQGLSKQFGDYKPRQEANQLKQQETLRKAQKINDPAAQKWAYTELGKQGAVKQLQSSLDNVERINKMNVTGPAKGRIPSFLAGEKEDAARKELVAEGTQILNVHKSMFPRGLTQGEFQNLEQKIVSPNNTPEANQSIINAYRRIGQLQEQKIKAVEEAINRHGFDPMLPLLVSGIDKEFDEAGKNLNQQMYNEIVGQSPSQGNSQQNMSGQGEGSETPGNPEGWRGQSEKPQGEFINAKHKKTGQPYRIPRNEFKPHEDLEVIEGMNG